MKRLLAACALLFIVGCEGIPDTLWDLKMSSYTYTNMGVIAVDVCKAHHCILHGYTAKKDEHGKWQYELIIQGSSENKEQVFADLLTLPD